MSDFVNSYDDAAIREMFNDDVGWCRLANEQRAALRTAPAQSHFKVYAIFIVEVGGKLQLVEGANAEQGYIGGAICAERSAIVKLRFLDNPIIRKIIVTTDSKLPIYCGVLCREYLQSVSESEVHVILTNCTGESILVCTVGSLYPYPLIYRFQSRFGLADFAKQFSARMSTKLDGPFSDQFKVLHSKAVSFTAFDNKDDIHPLRLAAALLFDNGDIEVAWQMKGMEYGCTLDPVSQLVHDIEKKKLLCGPCGASESATTESSSVLVYTTKPALLVIADQFGVCHAPVAMARSLLTEYGFNSLQLVVHDYDSGDLSIVTADDLVPHPNGGRSVCGLDFLP